MTLTNNTGSSYLNEQIAKFQREFPDFGALSHEAARSEAERWLLVSQLEVDLAQPISDETTRTVISKAAYRGLGELQRQQRFPDVTRLS